LRKKGKGKTGEGFGTLPVFTRDRRLCFLLMCVNVTILYTLRYLDYATH